MHIDKRALHAFIWVHFTRFIESKPEWADFPKTSVETRGDTFVILHQGSSSAPRGFVVPLSDDALNVAFKLFPEWEHVVRQYIGDIEDYKDKLLQAFSEHNGKCYPGVNYTVDFTEEELTDIDAVRLSVGESREEFVRGATMRAAKAMKLTFSTPQSFSVKVRSAVKGASVTLIPKDKDHVFIVGAKGSEVHVSKLVDVLRTDGSLETVSKVCDDIVRGCNVPIRVYRCAIANSPFEVTDEHEEWIKSIKDSMVVDVDLKDEYLEKLNARIDGEVIINVIRRGDVDVFIIGRADSEKYMKALETEYTNRHGDVSQEFITELFETAVKEGVPYFGLHATADTTSPLATSKYHEDWIAAYLRDVEQWPVK